MTGLEFLWAGEYRVPQLLAGLRVPQKQEEKAQGAFCSGLLGQDAA